MAEYEAENCDRVLADLPLDIGQRDLAAAIEVRSAFVDGFSGMRKLIERVGETLSPGEIKALSNIFAAGMGSYLAILPKI